MTSQIKEIPSLQVNLCSMIRSFFDTLYDDQVLSLLSDTMDETTRLLLLQLISNIINNLSTAVQTRVKEMNAEVTEELVVSSLGNAVTESFKAALDVKTPGQSRSAKTLRDMISQEVMVSVQCSMSDTPKEHVTDPERLEMMFKLVIRMLTWIVMKMPTPSTKEEVLEPEESATSGPLTGSMYTADNTDDISEEETVDISISIVQNFCTYDVGCCLDDISVFSPVPYLPSPVPYLPSDFPIIPSSAEESGYESSSMEFFFPSVTSEEDVSIPLAASPDDFQDRIKKSGVLLVVEKLVSLTCERNKVKHCGTDLIIERLMARTWAAVEDVDLEFSRKTYANLEKKIFKDLVKKWGCKSWVLVHMRVGSPALEEFVANAIKARLTVPKKQSCIRRFFTSVGRAMGFGRVSPVMEFGESLSPW